MAKGGIRLRREQQVERNRAELLSAARRVFLERGFHAASLDAIAEAAGFSKGVVYSQFESKADLFLALLEQRIEERARENERVAARAGGKAVASQIIALGERSVRANPEWALLVLEFRVHAARNPDLNERYARLHARTVARLAAALGDAGPDASAETRALFALAVGAGLTLERLAARVDLPDQQLRALAARSLEPAPPGAQGAPSAARVHARSGRAAPAARVRRGRAT